MNNINQLYNFIKKIKDKELREELIYIYDCSWDEIEALKKRVYDADARYNRLPYCTEISDRCRFKEAELAIKEIETYSRKELDKQYEESYKHNEDSYKWLTTQGKIYGYIDILKKIEALEVEHERR